MQNETGFRNSTLVPTAGPFRNAILAFVGIAFVTMAGLSVIAGMASEKSGATHFPLNSGSNSEFHSPTDSDMRMLAEVRAHTNAACGLVWIRAHSTFEVACRAIQ